MQPHTGNPRVSKRKPSFRIHSVVSWRLRQFVLQWRSRGHRFASAEKNAICAETVERETVCDVQEMHREPKHDVDYVVMDDREVCGLMGHGGRGRLAEICGRIWAAGSREKQSEEIATHPQINNAYRDVVVGRQRIRHARAHVFGLVSGLSETDRSSGEEGSDAQMLTMRSK